MVNWPMGKQYNSIAEADEGDVPITVEATVTELRETTHESQQQLGLLDDGTGEMRFVIWSGDDHPHVEVGSSYKFQHLLTDEYDEELSLKTTRKTTISELDYVAETLEEAIAPYKNSPRLVSGIEHQFEVDLHDLQNPDSADFSVSFSAIPDFPCSGDSRGTPGASMSIDFEGVIDGELILRVEHEVDYPQLSTALATIAVESVIEWADAHPPDQALGVREEFAKCPECGHLVSFRDGYDAIGLADESQGMYWDAFTEEEVACSECDSGVLEQVDAPTRLRYEYRVELEGATELSAILSRVEDAIGVAPEVVYSEYGQLRRLGREILASAGVSDTRIEIRETQSGDDEERAYIRYTKADPFDTDELGAIGEAASEYGEGITRVNASARQAIVDLSHHI